MAPPTKRVLLIGWGEEEPKVQWTFAVRRTPDTKSGWNGATGTYSTPDYD